MRQVTAAFLALFFMFSAAIAQDGEDFSAYSVSDVAVDVTAENAASARENALAQAQGEAFRLLLQRLGADEAVADGLDASEIAALVKAFEVQKEKSSAVRYIATFTIQFKPDAVRTLLNNRGSNFNDSGSKPIVVLPVTGGGRNVMWEDQNDWRGAWDAINRNSGLVPVIVPAGDLEDIAVISSAEALSGKQEAIQAIAAKYHAGGVAVTLLNADPSNPQFEQETTVDVRRYDSDGKFLSSVILSVPASPDAKAFSASIKEAVKSVRAEIERAWKRVNAVPKGPASNMLVAVPIASLSMWADIRNSLSEVPAVSKIKVVSLTRNAASLDMEYRGEISSLQEALWQKGLSLEHSADTGGWLLRKNP